MCIHNAHIWTAPIDLNVEQLGITTVLMFLLQFSATCAV